MDHIQITLLTVAILSLGVVWYTMRYRPGGDELPKMIWVIPHKYLEAGRMYIDVLPGPYFTPTRLVFSHRDSMRLYFDLVGEFNCRQTYAMKVLKDPTDESMGYWIVFPTIMQLPFYSTTEHPHAVAVGKPKSN